MAVGPPKDVFTHENPSPPTVGPALDVFSEPTSTGGGGTVTSVDVDGGTTGITTSGGPITSAGTITLHLDNNTQLAGRNALDNADIGLIGVNTFNQITLGSIGEMDETEAYLKIFLDAGNPDRGFISSSLSNANIGGMFVAERAGGVRGAPTIIPGGGGQAMGNYASRGYDGAAYLRTGIIQFQTTGAVGANSIPTTLAVYLSDGSVDAISTTPVFTTNDQGNFVIMPAMSGTTLNMLGSASLAIATVNTTPYAVDDSTDYTLLVDTTGGNITVNLPASPDTGRILNIKKIAAANTLTIGRNGKNIDGAASDLTVNVSMTSIALQYSGTFGWAVL